MFKLIYYLDCLKLEDFHGRNIMLNVETVVQFQSYNLLHHELRILERVNAVL
jgi:hypothetical protein